MHVKGINQTLGKTITGIIVKEDVTGDGRPASQVFLLFSDNTYYELYTAYDEISFTGGVDPGGRKEVTHYIATKMRVVYEAFLENQG
jgi:hypothetical protein